MLLFSKRIKGLVGEKTISSILSLLDKTEYHVINNIVLKSGEKTTQIDHIIISDYGIFVIETKNFKGWIFGGENSEYWTQVLFKRKEKFYNPIKQNLSHIHALKMCLNEFPNIEYKSIIVFSTRAKINVNTSTEVIYSYQLLSYIKYPKNKNLSKNDKELIFRKISSQNLVDTFDKQKHIKSIKSRIKKREKLITENKCPNCGNNLIIRQGKFGNFIGCNSYPKCNFIKNI
jgi:predicted RNA-binding Zn-ribbon protein involved in translation (DUF1610 family)